MCYKSGIYMKRSVKFFGLALLFLFSARFVYSQDMGMPDAQQDATVSVNLTALPAQPVSVIPTASIALPTQPVSVIPAVSTPPVQPASTVPAAQTISEASAQPVSVTPTVSEPLEQQPVSGQTVQAVSVNQESEMPGQTGIPDQIVEPNNFLPTQELSGMNGLPADGSSAVNILNSFSPSDNNKKIDSNSSEKDIYLNFDNADLSNFVNYIAEIRQMNLVVDKTIESVKISLTIREPLTADGAWNVFLTVLEMAGFSLIKIPGEQNTDPLIFKVIPKDQKLTQPLPAYINVAPETLPDNDINIRYVLFLTNMNVADLEELLKSMLSDKGFELAVKDVNGFVITDKSLNVKAAAKVLLELDQMGSVEAVTVIKLKNANAVDVKTLLDGLIKQPEVSPLARLLGKTAEGTTSYFPPGTRVIAEERTNSLILLGNPKPIKKIEEFIVNHLDTELKQAKSPLHVYELQYTDATQIAAILQEATTMPESVAGQNATKYGAIRGGVKYFKSMIFKVDKDGNRLIVSSTDKVDWKLLKKTIRDLDKPQPQVAIESMIVTVDVIDTKELGGAVRNKKHGMLGINIDAQGSGPSDSPQLEYSPPESTTNPVSLLGDMLKQITPVQGLATLTFGKPGNIWGYLQALKSITNTAVLSQPFMTIANKTAAQILFGTQYRVVQEVQGGTDGLKGYEPIDANTNLTITPQINLDGLVRLDIDLQIDEFIDPAAGSKTKRNLKTNVAVANGQVLVLGGFVKTQVTESKHKTPILGDIPILGWLFKDQERIITKQYIFIFLCPTIVKPRQTPGMNLYTKMKLHEATDRIEDGITTKRTPDSVHNWFFNPDKENYSHKVIDFANARYQPTTVDIKNDPYYRAQTVRAEAEAEQRGNGDEEDIVTQVVKDQKNLESAKFETVKTVGDDAVKMVGPEAVQPVSVSNDQQMPAITTQSSFTQSAFPMVGQPMETSVANLAQPVVSMPGDGLVFMKPSMNVENASVLPVQPSVQITAQVQPLPQASLPQASLIQPIDTQTQIQNISPKPVIEQTKREEFKQFISQEPLSVRAPVSVGTTSGKPVSVDTASVRTVPAEVVPAEVVPVEKTSRQASQINSQTDLKRDEFKRLLSSEPKFGVKRSQDLNFDIQKRNRLKEFLSKNPSLTKSRVIGAKNEALT